MRRFAPLLLALPLLACGDDDESSSSFPTAVADQAISNYKVLVNSNYADVLTTATALKAAVAAFVASPTPVTQKAAQDAWIAARVPYGPSEAFRFYDGPIDNPDDGPEGLINSWPLDENFIDSTRDDPAAGIVNDPSAEISPASLTAINAARGEAEISTGYHAIEFLLWGQDDATPGLGAGKRASTDYTTAANFERRKQYLTVVTDLLLTNLQQVADQWKPGAANYAAQFGVTAVESGANPQQEAISDLLKSIGSMAKAELSGERMTVAYSHKDQEDEHSCFSDNTSVDLLGNGLGIQNVWLGRYGTVDGVGVQDVVNAADPVLAAKTTTDLEAAVGKLQELANLQKAGTPFDVIISAADADPNRKIMLDAITALKTVGGDVEQAAG
ncbi:MAG TPA: imelysin family protein, partial [Polyangiales bacterium]|nr:imelysin family protein [Polyangiales bacterium]